MLLAGLIIAFFLPLALSEWIGQTHIIYYDKLFYSRFFYWGTILTLLLYARMVERQPLLIITESKPPAGTFLVWVLVLYLLFIVAAIVSAIPALFGLHEDNAMIKVIAKLLTGHEWMVFFLALTAGVTEELIMRGYILTRLLQLSKSPVIAIVVSSLMFSALHYRYNSLRELIFAFMIGAIYGAFYVKYRNIKAIMIAHFLIDFINMSLATHLKLK